MKLNTKIFMILLALALCATGFFACAKEEETDLPEGYLLAENPGGDYDFYYPETWLLDRSDAGLVSAHASDGDFSNVNITAITAPSLYPTLASYAEHFYFEQFRDYFQNLTLPENEDGTPKITALTVDGYEAIFIDYSAFFGEEEYAFRTYLVSCGGNIYNLTYTAKAELFQTHLDEVEGIVANIRFH